MATSEKQLAANRANAKKSTGPRSEIGKKHSSQNARKHGLTSERIGINFMEAKPDLEAHRNVILEFYNPQNPMELYHVDQIILAQWRSKQLARWESGIFNDAVTKSWEDQFDVDDEDAEDLEQYITNIEEDDTDTLQNSMISYGMAKLMSKKDYLKTFLRYQAQAERLIRRAEEAIANLRNEPKFSRQRIDLTTASTPVKEPISSAWQPPPMPQ